MLLCMGQEIDSIYEQFKYSSDCSKLVANVIEGFDRWVQQVKYVIVSDISPGAAEFIPEYPPFHTREPVTGRTL